MQLNGRQRLATVIFAVWLCLVAVVGFANMRYQYNYDAADMLPKQYHPLLLYGAEAFIDGVELDPSTGRNFYINKYVPVRFHSSIVAAYENGVAADERAQLAKHALNLLFVALLPILLLGVAFKAFVWVRKGFHDDRAES